jgi:16S rRNA (cytosine1402-N4)-methyltransferase
MNLYHEPVLLKEVEVSLFPQGSDNGRNQGKYIDCTLGAGGYTKMILSHGGAVLGIDTDEQMLNIARENIQDKNALLVHGNFRNLKQIANKYGFNQVDGVVLDLGVSNVHFSDETRGFSFKNPNAELDMRLDPKSQAVKAKDLLNGLREDQLVEILGRSLAKKIIEFRAAKKFEKVEDFLSLFPEKRKQDKIHPATKAFMMIRIAVNSELDNLRDVLPQAYELLKPKGKLVVVSFHSLEEKQVKNFIREKGGSGEFIKPSGEEIKRNPKSRSAVLRVLEKNV